MNAKCPFCSYPYEVEEEGKFQCGICGSRFYVFPEEIIVSGEANRFGSGGMIADRYRVIGELFPGSSEDVMYCCVDEMLGKVVCLVDSRPEEGYSRINSHCRFIVAGDIDIPGRSVVKSEANVPQIKYANVVKEPVTPVAEAVPAAEEPAAENAPAAAVKPGKAVLKKIPPRITAVTLILILALLALVGIYRSESLRQELEELKAKTAETVSSIEKHTDHLSE
jgi:hypothetical protein